MDKQLIIAESTLGDVTSQRNCSVARTLERIGEGWSFLVLRSAYFGVKHFEDFVRSLDAPRVQIAQALRRLIEARLLERDLDETYRIGDAGVDFFAVCISMMRWGDDFARPALHPEQKSPPLALRWRADGRPILPISVCTKCGHPYIARDCYYVDGAGAGHEPRAKGRRRSADKTLYARAQPCSVASTLEIIGDWWSFMILREAFLGQHRFEQFASSLAIARNTLTDRLDALVESGVLYRRPIDPGSSRMEYALTYAGTALFPTIVEMISWGDKWLALEQKAPIVITHRICGQVLVPQQIDQYSGRLLHPAAVVPIDMH